MRRLLRRGLLPPPPPPTPATPPPRPAAAERPASSAARQGRGQRRSSTRAATHSRSRARGGALCGRAPRDVLIRATDYRLAHVSSSPFACATARPCRRSERHFSAFALPSSTSSSSNGYGGDLTLARPPHPSRLGADSGALATRLSGWFAHPVRSTSDLSIDYNQRLPFATTVHKQESLPWLVFSPAFQFYGFSSSVGVRVISRGHGGEVLVSFRFHPQLSRPLSRPRPFSASGPATRPALPSI